MASVERTGLPDSELGTELEQASVVTAFTVFITSKEEIVCGSYSDRFRVTFGEITTLSEWATALDDGHAFLRAYEVTRDQQIPALGMANRLSEHQLDISLYPHPTELHWQIMVVQVKTSAHEEAKKESFSNLLISHIQDSIIAVDSDGIITYFNEGAERIFEMDRREMEGHSIEKLGPGFHPDMFRKMLEDGIKFNVSEWHYKTDQFDKWVRVTTGPIATEAGEFAGVIGTAKEITEKKLLEQELLLHKDLLEDLFDVHHMGILIVNEQREVEYCNKKAAKRLNQWYGCEILKGRGLHFVDDLAGQRIFDTIERVSKGEQVHWEEFYFEDGEDQWFDLYFYGIQTRGRTFVACLIENITELRKREISLSKTSSELDSFFNLSFSGMFISDLNGNITLTNPAFDRLFDYGSTPLNYVQISVPSDFVNEFNLYHDLLAGQLDSYEIAKSFICKDGRIANCTVQLSLVRNLDKQPDHLIGIIHDVTQERAMVQELWNMRNRIKLANEAAGIGIWEYNLSEEQLYWDRCMCLIYGLPPEDNLELTFEHWSLMLHPEDLETVIKATSDLMNGAPKMDLIFRMNRNNETRYIQTYAVKMEQDGMSKLIGLNWDVTDAVVNRQRILELNADLKRSEGYTRALLERGQDAVLVVGKDRIIRDATISTLNVVGYHHTEFIGQPLTHLFDFSTKDDFEQEWSTMIQHGKSSFQLELSYNHPNGSTIWLECMFTNMLYNESVAGVVMNYRDITIRRRSIELLEKSRLAAEEVSKLKSSFLANMSHEIRTPLNGIVGLATLIKEASSEEKTKEYAALQIQSSKRLLETVNSILEMAKLESKAPTFNNETYNLCELVRNGVKSFEHMANVKGLRFEFGCSNGHLMASIDPGVIHQIINNVVGNAVKFTPDGSVKVHCFDETTRDAMFFCIQVADTGVGIDSTFLERLFVPFEQESRGYSRKFEGSGLGLSITKKFIEILGGSIEVDSVKNVGSTFLIKIPIVPI